MPGWHDGTNVVHDVAVAFRVFFWSRRDEQKAPLFFFFFLTSCFAAWRRARVDPGPCGMTESFWAVTKGAAHTRFFRLEEGNDLISRQAHVAQAGELEESVSRG